MTSEDHTAHASHHIYRCTECGTQTLSLGKLHSHIEKHRGLFGIQWPWSVGDFDELLDLTEVVVVEEVETYTGDDVREWLDGSEVGK